MFARVWRHNPHRIDDSNDRPWTTNATSAPASPCAAPPVTVGYDITVSAVMSDHRSA